MQNMPRTSRKRANQCLINARLQRGWTQREVAEAVGTTLANVSRWERGVTFPSPHFRQKLCEVFEMSPEDLNLTCAQRYSSPICHAAAASQSLDPSEQRNSLERQEINFANNGYKQKQKDFPMSHVEVLEF